MKYKKGIFIIIFAIVILFFISTKVNAGSLRLNNLMYDVELNSDGTADVTETWNIYIEDTNTLFKTFEIDKSKYKEITDVSVTEVSNGSQIPFTRIDQEMYHVDKGKFYALVNKDRKFEIAWGVHVENRTKTYKISYKIIDAVKNYNDCSEFYWQFISNESEIPAKHVSGIITLPEQVTDMEQFRVWAHGPLNGNIEKISNDKVKFDVSNFFERTMLEVRVTTPNSVFWENLNTQNTNKINEILKEEQKWADEANARRESIKRQQEIVDNIFTIGCILFQGLGVIIAIVVIVKITKYIKVLKESPKIVPEQKFKWYRDIPDETATPAEAGVLYYFKGGTGASYNATKYVSATMLDLCLKKYIEFEVLANAKEEIKVIIKPGKVAEELPEDEKIVYELLLDVAKDKNSFTMKDFKKYCNNNYSVLSKFLNIENKAKDVQTAKGNYDKEVMKKANDYASKVVGYVFLFMFSVFSMFAAIIPSIIATIVCAKVTNRLKRLTQKGMNEKAQWEGLKRYMEEFSMIDEKTVPELVLWEKYLVYATSFGIADKVLKQLKVVYPQITDSDYMSSYGCSYMHLMYSGAIKTSLINSINTSVQSSVYTSESYSSGSGSGGGFSSGGGGGGGGGRNGWKMITLDASLG